MPKHTIRNVLTKWETARDLAGTALSDAIEDDDRYRQIQEALWSRPASTVHGLMATQVAVRDANGNDVPFPLELLVEVTFDPNDANQASS